MGGFGRNFYLNICILLCLKYTLNGYLNAGDSIMHMFPKKMKVSTPPR